MAVCEPLTHAAPPEMLCCVPSTKRACDEPLCDPRPLKRASIALQQLDGSCRFTETLFAALFAAPAHTLCERFAWPESMARQFAADATLQTHYACERVDPMTHKACFSLRGRCKLKLCQLRESELRVAVHEQEWHALVSNCVITLCGEPTRFRGLSVHLLGQAETLQLDASQFSEGQRALDVAQLGAPHQWCYVVSRSELHFRFAGEEDGKRDGLFLFSGEDSEVHMDLGDAFLEHWSAEAQAQRPYRYSVDNARVQSRLYAYLRGRGDRNPLHATLGPPRLGARYVGQYADFSTDRPRYVALLRLRVYFAASDPVPLFFLDGVQLMVILHAPHLRGTERLTVFGADGVALADLTLERDAHVMRFVMLYREEVRRGDLLRYHVYK